jgi:cytochrome c biogenesis protein CcmG/thiol:disulfide interchange protein DsbE
MKQLLTAIAFIGLFQLGAQELPSTMLKTLDGQSINIQDAISDEGPTVISFWATWCKPCIKELTAFMDYAIDLEEEVGAKVLAVSIDDSRNSSRVAPMVQGQGWEYTVLLDENQGKSMVSDSLFDNEISLKTTSPFKLNDEFPICK